VLRRSARALRRTRRLRAGVRAGPRDRPPRPAPRGPRRARERRTKRRAGAREPDLGVSGAPGRLLRGSLGTSRRAARGARARRRRGGPARGGRDRRRPHPEDVRSRCAPGIVHAWLFGAARAVAAPRTRERRPGGVQHLPAGEGVSMFLLGTLARCLPRGVAAALVLFAPLLAAGQATLGAKGDTIHGRVAGLTAEGVVFEPASGKGQIAVNWADVQSLETEGNYSVMHGAEGETRGRILGFEGGEFILVGDAPATAERVEIGTLFHAYDESKMAGSWVERMRSRLRFWMATLDASAAYTNSTTDTMAGAAGFLIDRKKEPHHP